MSIVLPIRERELIPGLTLLLVLIVGLFVVVVRERLLDGVLVLIELPMRDVLDELIRLLVLVVGLFVIVVRERLLDGVLVLIELPIRDDMLGLIRLLVLGAVGRELIDRLVMDLLETLLLGARLVIDLLEMLLLGVLVLIELPIRDDMLGLIRLLVLGDVGRELIDRLETLLLGARLVIDLLEVLLLGARLVIDLLETLLLGARLVMDRLEVLLLGARLVIDLLDVLLLGARLVIDRLEVLLLGVRLDETLLERLDDDDLLDVALGAGAGLEACRVCLLELLDLLLLERFVAAKTGSQNNKRANNTQEIRKKEPSRRDPSILTFDF